MWTPVHSDCLCIYDLNRVWGQKCLQIFLFVLCSAVAARLFLFQLSFPIGAGSVCVISKGMWVLVLILARELWRANNTAQYLLKTFIWNLSLVF